MRQRSGWAQAGGQGRAQVSEQRMRAQVHLRKEEENPGGAEKCDTEWKGEGEVRASRREESERMRILGCPPTRHSACSTLLSPQSGSTEPPALLTDASRALPHVYAGE